MYTIKLKSPEGIIEKEVEAVPIRFQGFDFFVCFISQCDGSYGLQDVDGHRIKDIKGKFIITEQSTGRYCSTPCDNPEQAYYESSKWLNEMGEDRVRGMLEKGRVTPL